MSMPVFVYGTLRHGHGNYNRLLRGRTTHECPAVVEGELYSAHGRTSFPALMPGTDRVHGELMFIEEDQADEVLQSLDRLEGYREGGHHNMYNRALADVLDPETGSVLHRAWVYYWNMNDIGERIVNGDWTNPEFAEAI